MQMFPTRRLFLDFGNSNGSFIFSFTETSSFEKALPQIACYDDRSAFASILGNLYLACVGAALAPACLAQCLKL
jgi:hypothetical protein